MRLWSCGETPENSRALRRLRNHCRVRGEIDLPVGSPGSKQWGRLRSISMGTASSGSPARNFARAAAGATLAVRNRGRLLVARAARRLLHSFPPMPSLSALFFPRALWPGTRLLCSLQYLGGTVGSRTIRDEGGATHVSPMPHALGMALDYHLRTARNYQLNPP